MMKYPSIENHFNIKFPFLIGKVLTVVLFLTIGVHVCKYMDSFPFLIGKVLTF